MTERLKKEILKLVIDEVVIEGESVKIFATTPLQNKIHEREMDPTSLPPALKLWRRRKVRRPGKTDIPGPLRRSFSEASIFNAGAILGPVNETNMLRIWNKHKQSNTPLKRKVFVGMSGGVDSSVSAFLLKEAGFDVTGVFIQGWYPDFLLCNWKDERRDAMRVAAKLDIPFLTINAEDTYKKEVIDYMVHEYSLGRTPNPDVMCNRHVKFGVFFNEAMKQGADYIATGHYAQVEHGGLGGDVTLKSAVDPEKDQTYFLWNVPKRALAKTLFPIGHLKKDEVRTIARKVGLITADKKDSQGVCFLGKVSMKDFLKHSIYTERGDLLDMEGNVIGYHEGALLYTLGERKGFTVTKKGTDDAPRYVVSKDSIKNTLTVSEKNDVLFPSHSLHEVTLTHTNWISREPEEGEMLMARFRHRQLLRPVRISRGSSDGDEKGGVWTIVFDTAEEAVSSGQSLVLYKDDICLGGGIIK